MGQISVERVWTDLFITPGGTTCLFPSLTSKLFLSTTCFCHISSCLNPVRKVLAFPNFFNCSEDEQRKKTTVCPLNSSAFCRPQETSRTLSGRHWIYQILGENADSCICERLYCVNGDMYRQLLLVYYQRCNNVCSVLRKLSVPCLPC